jgi:dolichol kinase
MNGKKSLGGGLCAFIVGFLSSKIWIECISRTWYPLLASKNEMAPLAFYLFGGMACTIGEGAVVGTLDDNLTMPIVGGFLLRVAVLLFGIE